jgi:hypothetical protein
MSRSTVVITVLCCLLCTAAMLLGCSERGSPPDAQTVPATRPRPSHEIEDSTLTMRDPAGRWTFHVAAERVEAASVEGPYELEAPECRYEKVGETPMLMAADRAQFDRASACVTLLGNARIWSDTWQLEDERIQYDLTTGEVVVGGGGN